MSRVSLEQSEARGVLRAIAELQSVGQEGETAVLEAGRFFEAYDKVSREREREREKQSGE